MVQSMIDKAEQGTYTVRNESPNHPSGTYLSKVIKLLFYIEQ